MALPPLYAIIFQVELAEDPDISATSTAMPALANLRAQALPMPAPDPVITATSADWSCLISFSPIKQYSHYRLSFLVGQGIGLFTIRGQKFVRHQA